MSNFSMNYPEHLRVISFDLILPTKISRELKNGIQRYGERPFGTEI